MEDARQHMCTLCQQEAQRRKLEDEAKEKAWKETQKQHQAARTKHKEEAAAAAGAAFSSIPVVILIVSRGC